MKKHVSKLSLVSYAFLTTCLLVSSPHVYSEDDFELDFDFGLGIKRKSDISNFHLKEIGADELSEAAIGNALQAMSAHDVETTGKPAYAEQNETDDKREVTELEGSDVSKISEVQLIDGPKEVIYIPPPQIKLPQAVINSGQTDIGVGYNQDTIYQNNNTFFERP